MKQLEDYYKIVRSDIEDVLKNLPTQTEKTNIWVPVWRAENSLGKILPSSHIETDCQCFLDALRERNHTFTKKALESMFEKNFEGLH
jgi:hypothetical protein